MQRYGEKKIRVCDKNSIPFFELQIVGGKIKTHLNYFFFVCKGAMLKEKTETSLFNF